MRLSLQHDPPPRLRGSSPEVTEKMEFMPNGGMPAGSWTLQRVHYLHGGHLVLRLPAEFMFRIQAGGPAQPCPGKRPRVGTLVESGLTRHGPSRTPSIADEIFVALSQSAAPLRLAARPTPYRVSPSGRAPMGPPSRTTPTSHLHGGAFDCRVASRRPAVRCAVTFCSSTHAILGQPLTGCLIGHPDVKTPTLVLHRVPAMLCRTLSANCDAASCSSPPPYRGKPLARTRGHHSKTYHCNSARLRGAIKHTVALLPPASPPRLAV